MRFLSLFTAFIFAIANANAAMFDGSDLKDNTRNKKSLNASVGFVYQLSNSSYYYTNSSGFNGAINSNNVGFNVDLKFNHTGKLWTNLYVQGVNMINVSNGFVSNYSGNAGYNYEIKAVVGYDVMSYENIDLAVYGGLEHFGILSSSQVTTNTSLNFTGAVMGASLTQYLKGMVNTFFFEGYLTGYYGNSGSSTTTSTAPAGGFGVGASTEIEVAQNLFIAPSAKYQMLFAGNLSSSGSGTMNNMVYSFQALTLGLGLSWR